MLLTLSFSSRGVELRGIGKADCALAAAMAALLALWLVRFVLVVVFPVMLGVEVAVGILLIEDLKGAVDLLSAGFAVEAEDLSQTLIILELRVLLLRLHTLDALELIPGASLAYFKVEHLL